MKKQQIQALHSIENIDINNPILQRPAKTPQQQFLHSYASVYHLRLGQLTSNIKQIINSNKGSFVSLLNNLKYMAYSMDNKQNLENQQFRVLGLLVKWMENLDTLKNNPSIEMFTHVLHFDGEKSSLSYYEELIVYLNYIGIDLQKIIKKNSGEQLTRANATHFSHLQVEDLLTFLSGVLPKIYYNIIFPSQAFQYLRNTLQKKSQIDMLYAIESLQYFANTKPHYQTLLRTIFRVLLIMDLKSNHMKELMELSFRYYLLFHHQKKCAAGEIFVQCYNKITEAVRFAISDQFILFFKIVAKLGQHSFISFMREKYEWVNNLLEKINKNAIIGNPKDSIIPFNPMQIHQTVRVERGKIECRYFQIFSSYSLFYFLIEPESHDITFRLYYLGDFESKIEYKKLLINQEKKSQLVRNAFLASKKGIYMFEFDNSYSWINGKTIKYQNVVLALAEQKPQENPIWLDVLYENVEFVDEDLIQEEQKIEKNKEDKSKNKEEKKSKQNKEKIQRQREEKSKTNVRQQIEDKKPKVQKNIKSQPKASEKIPHWQQATQNKKKQPPKEQKKSSQQILPQTEELNKSAINEKKEIKQQKKQVKSSEKISVEDKKVEKASSKENNSLVQQNQKDKSALLIKPPPKKQNNFQQTISQLAVDEKKMEKKQQRKEDNNKRQQKVPQVQKNTQKLQNLQKREQKNGKIEQLAGQANLSLIDGIFSLLVSLQNHTYEFETNLEDKIARRLKKYLEGPERIQWTFNGQAREWLKKQNISLIQRPKSQEQINSPSKA